MLTNFSNQGRTGIGTKKRPFEVSIWVKSGRRSIKPNIANIVKYKASWQTWWQGLQPEWRLLEDGTFLQEVPDTGEEWETLRRGGPNGFFVIVLALGWWAAAMDWKDDIGLLNALDDVTWVVRCMADLPATPGQLTGGKHALEDKQDTSGKKRYVFSFLILLMPMD
jgi:hypothetical protein